MILLTKNGKPYRLITVDQWLNALNIDLAGLDFDYLIDFQDYLDFLGDI